MTKADRKQQLNFLLGDYEEIIEAQGEIIADIQNEQSFHTKSKILQLLEEAENSHPTIHTPPPETQPEPACNAERRAI